MDIKAILTEHGIETEAIAGLSKAIEKAVGDEFVDKRRYKDKLTDIENLKQDLKTTKDNAATAEAYKQKYDDEAAAHAETKKALKKELDDYRGTVEADKTAATKHAALRKQLIADGAHEKAVDLLELVFDISKIELEGERIKDWESVSKPVKEQYADFFGTVTVEGVNPANPPVWKQEKSDLFIDGFDGK